MNIIERILKIKFILLSETMFNKNSSDINRIINCGNDNNGFTKSKCAICGVDSSIHSSIMTDKIELSDIKSYLNKHGVKDTARSDKLKLYKELSKESKHTFVDVQITTPVPPKKFILLNYEDNRHYKLISYKDRTEFTKLSQLPEKLKLTLQAKCNKQLSKFR